MKSIIAAVGVLFIAMTVNGRFFTADQDGAGSFESADAVDSVEAPGAEASERTRREAQDPMQNMMKMGQALAQQSGFNTTNMTLPSNMKGMMGNMQNMMKSG
ncbi:uncharacterized protein LOC134541970 [Bacillus rossius redtenbacheri]|uniref:uncharacterized protein LOC134541970 n=1 Tax=Bacillus rossius redtenbacheri TaxID=93214 RepID=UPI002FDE7C59